MRIRAIRLAVLFTVAAVTAGCNWRSKPVGARSYETVATDPSRRTDEARRHNAVAVRMLRDDKLDDAEAELKAALAADVFFGPAHNNLGNVYFRQRKYYRAAWEFQYATKLMPNHAQPRHNLGLVLETVGKLDDAAKWYEEALTIEPDSPEIIGNLARTYIRANRKDDRTRDLLEQIAMKDERSEWIEWASLRLKTMPKPEPDYTHPLVPLAPTTRPAKKPAKSTGPTDTQPPGK